MRGRRTERGSERKRPGRGRGLKASVDAEASSVGREEANEIASGQGCRRRGRGHADGHQMRNSPGDQGRLRKKAEDNERMPPEKGIQCGRAERTGGTGDTRLWRHRAGREGHEAPGGGHARGGPQVNRQGQSGALVAQRTPWRRAPEQAADAVRLNEGAAKSHGPRAQHT